MHDATKEISDFLTLINTHCPHINSLSFEFNWFRNCRQISQDLNQFTQLTHLTLINTDIQLPYDRECTPDVFSRLMHLGIMGSNAFHLACFSTQMVQITLQQLEFYYTSAGCTDGPSAITITENINHIGKEWQQILLVIRLCLQVQCQCQYYHQPPSNCKFKRRQRNKHFLRFRNRHFKQSLFLQLPEELVQHISDYLLPATPTNAVHNKKTVNLSPLRMRY